MVADEHVARAVRDKVAATSAAKVAKALGISRASVGSFLAGISQPGTVALVEQRARKLGWLPDTSKGKR